MEARLTVAGPAGPAPRAVTAGPDIDPDGPLFPVAVPKERFSGRWAELRRMTPAVAWHRLTKPLSRMRHERADRAVAARFAKPALAARPPGGRVCIIGALGARNGLSRAARYELDRLLALHPGADLIDLRKHGDRALRDYALARRDDPPATAIFLLQPNLVWKHLRDIPAAFLAKSYRISLAVWELPYFPAQWHFIDGFFHEYWTPSGFSAAALRQGTRLPVRVVPHRVAMPAPAAAPQAGPDAPFRGLAIMDLSTCPDRKNPWAHVEAWIKAFGERPDAVLTLKLRFSRRTAPIRRELQAMIGAAGNIRIVEDELTDDEVVELQRDSDVCLSLHRAEGFGLTICEMLELGKPAVATGWSGNMDFMDRYPKAHAAGYRLVPYRDYLRRYPGYAGTWAEADTDDAARTLRRLAAERRSGTTGQAARDGVAAPLRERA